jgi:hypothetical protein
LTMVMTLFVMFWAIAGLLAIVFDPGVERTMALPAADGKSAGPARAHAHPCP